VALLRGVNVSGHNKLPMAALRELAAGLGLTGATTYLQSGNLVFTDPGGPGEQVARALEGAVAEAVGNDVRVVLRSHQDLATVLATNPFLGPADPGTLHVTFLTAGPAGAGPRSAAGAPSAGPGDDRYALSGREVYLHCPAGYGRTKLDNAYWERRLGVGATTRNWRTVTALTRLSGPEPDLSEPGSAGAAL
jgi:uncharacterized protein (DUF1697 family)